MGFLSKSTPVVQPTQKADWTKNIVVKKLVTGASQSLTIEEFTEAVIYYLSTANVAECSREEGYYQCLLTILGKYSPEFNAELSCFDSEQASIQTTLSAAGIPDVELKVNELLRNKLAKAEQESKAHAVQSQEETFSQEGLF